MSSDGDIRERRRRVAVERRSGSTVSRGDDWAVVEEPLEVQVNRRSFAVTMRTPGHDAELAVGLLFSEGVIRSPDEVIEVEDASFAPSTEPQSRTSERPSAPPAPGLSGRRISVRLSDEAFDRWARNRVHREIIATSACGVCGKPSLEDLWQELVPLATLDWDRDRRAELIEQMHASQSLFRHTGGAHAAAMFTASGELCATYEDVGRHNALDKLIGSRLLSGESDLSGSIVTSSGRAGFEIVQKAIVARVPVVLAVGAASTLAAELAAQAGLELHSFVAAQRGNRHLS